MGRKKKLYIKLPCQLTNEIIPAKPRRTYTEEEKTERNRKQREIYKKRHFINVL